MSLARAAEADYSDVSLEAPEGISQFKSQEELDAFIAKLETYMREATKLPDTIRDLCEDGRAVRLMKTLAESGTQ